MIDQIQSVSEAAIKEIAQTQTVAALETVRVNVLGKKGALSEILKGLGKASADDRPKIGAVANEWKSKIEIALDTKRDELENKELEAKLLTEKIDVTLPGRIIHRGALHPITQATRKLIDVFSRIGFDLMTGPEVETDYLCFEAVNIPKDHPARDMQDTFFLGPGVLLRTQTTAIQTRAMRNSKPPVRIICPGAVFRNDNDATHSPMFHQIEGLWIDEGVKMSHLKGVLDLFAKEVFGSQTKIRLRPSYFPFVEPGAEVDVSCFKCGGKEPTCKICKGTGWLEILGAGMVHPRLLELAGYDTTKVSGFAFGMGIDRISLILNDVPDLRLMFEGDSRFLSQF